jgi:DNA repair exonuclease SbcCD ATPase subunit
MAKDIIVHLADIHIRFGSRHEEYKTVFDRTVSDIKKLKPRRIVVAGDLFHVKINLSPISLTLAGNFLRDLSKIANVDIILGNHDVNLQSLSQGNAISPLIELLENGFTLTKENNKLQKPKSGNGIYFYKDSGFYDIEEDLVYGVYSCWDNEILSLKKDEKDPNKKYVALFHGPVYGCRGDNGYEMKGDGLIKTSVFKNFDCIMFGDIHSFQSFEVGDKECAAYSGSLIQQNYGEELQKGYLVWDLEDFSFERRYIPNDYGFCKINISEGEIWEDRLEESLQFSLNKKKTKVSIELEDYEENYSVEKLSQIESYIKSKHGCEVVNVDFKPIYKEKSLETNSEEVDIHNSESAERLLIEFLEQNSYTNSEDVLALSKEVDVALNYKPNFRNGLRIEFNKMEVNNLLSFPNELTVFDLDKLNGVIGIFGENYNGKSNLIKSLVWILYQKILGDGEPSRLINMYTGASKAYGRLYFTIENVKYYVHRGVSVRKKKDGTPDVSYSIEYKYEKNYQDDDGITKTKWVDAESEEAATEKKELKKMISEALGSYEDFTKIALQGGREDYLSLSQQPKNDLINKFLGLEIYRDRYDHANETFKTIKSSQKTLGDPIELETKVNETKKRIEDENIVLEKLTKEKGENLDVIEEYNKQILQHTSQLHKIDIQGETDKEVISKSIELEREKIKKEQGLSSVLEEWLRLNYKKEVPENVSDKLKETNKESVEAKIKKSEFDIVEFEKQIPDIEEWLKLNFKKELPENADTLDFVSLNNDLKIKQNSFSSEKDEWIKIDKWVKENPKKEEKEIESVEKEVEDLKGRLVELNNQLKLSKGEQCPTCKHVSHEPNPELEKKTLNDIENVNKFLKDKSDFIKLQKENSAHNIKFEKESNRLESLKNILTAKKLEIDEIKKNIDVCAKKDEIVLHNKKVEEQNNKAIQLRNDIDKLKKNIEFLKEQIVFIEKKVLYDAAILHNGKVDIETNKLNGIKSSIEQKEKNIVKFEEQITIINKNAKLILENEEIKKKIQGVDENIKVYKTLNLQVDNKIKESSGNIRVWQSDITNSEEKLNQIREAERAYKKYSVYLQAVGRDGIPANIIRKKIPIINHKINSLLKGMVNFKVEMYMKTNGDVKEMFYYSENKSDVLPISMGSGSQKFLTSLAISDALHFVSSLIKPSLRAIDEGFDTLDNKKLMELGNVFSYLKNKYKLVFIITHKAEVKDFVDHVIEVSKTKKGVSEEQLNDNPEAGISQFLIK